MCMFLCFLSFVSLCFYPVANLVDFFFTHRLPNGPFYAVCTVFIFLLVSVDGFEDRSIRFQELKQVSFTRVAQTSTNSH